MRLLILILAFLCLAGTAHAASEPVFAPAESWIEQLEIPAPDPDLRDRPFQTLLITNQSRYGADHHDHYTEMAIFIQNAQGLQGLGNITLPWRPEQSDLIVHKVIIRRGDIVIDLLAAGHRFTVLRRETNLEAAILDGTLTAVMQAEGLAVGDILDVAFTIRRRGGELPLRGENVAFAAPGAKARRFHIRQLWPSTMTMRWRGTGPLDRAEMRSTRLGNELVLDTRDIEGPTPPEQAPARFGMPSILQVTEYRDWAEISAIVAPHYARASRLSPNSPLQVEIGRIAARTSDLRARAMAALRLVQDEVRYFALVMGDGNYLPASAEETWARRYGDCKAKTVLLVGLLRGLGIEAEPLLVNTAAGDGIHDLLPQFSAFNHVIVRATIDGRVYLLDGTRTGDRDIVSLTSSRLGWGLPVRSDGAALERLPFAPERLPSSESRLTFDASRGMLGSVPVTGELIYRGEFAAMLRAAQAQGGAEAIRQIARTAVEEQISAEGLQISPDYDDESGTFTIRFSGTQTMTWSGRSGSRTVQYRFSNDTITWNPDFERDTGTQRDAPFLLPASHIASTETIILPDDGEGFAMEGESIDRTIAGVRLTRTLTLENGRAISHTAFQPLQGEIPAAEARASRTALQAIADSTASVRAASKVLNRSDRQALESRAPTTANDFVERGYGYLGEGDLERAAADFDRAAELTPDWSRPLSNRAIVEAHRRNFEQAESLIARAEALDRSDFVVHQARGLIALGRDQPVQAVTAFTTSLATEPDNIFNLMRRAYAYEQLGALDAALGDYDHILLREPANIQALLAKARIHVWRNEREQAIAAADAYVAINPDDPMMIQLRGFVLRRLGMDEEAAQSYGEAVASIDARMANASPDAVEGLGALRQSILADSGQTQLALEALDAMMERRPDDPELLNSRCWLRVTANVELQRALEDCNRSLEIRPDNAPTLDSRALVKLRLGQMDGAIEDASAAIARAPQMAAAHYVRGVAHFRRGNTAAGQQDLTTARRLSFDIDATYRSYGVTPP